ncbi:MAG TPA: SsrA-binding protein SmpB [Planctomycetota bacterium]|nr:SsrA-binding protein SmpB [Planctomycetota bacterium]
MKEERTVVTRNRKAFHDYEVVERVEAGVSLLGPEVKSLREGKASLQEAYAAFKGDELFLLQMHVPEYAHKGYAPHDPVRPRKLLLHRQELRRLFTSVERRGFTLIPLEIYFKKGRAKVELALARGRKHGDRREHVREQEARREARQTERRAR